MNAPGLPDSLQRYDAWFGQAMAASARPVEELADQPAQTRTASQPQPVQTQQADRTLPQTYNQAMKSLQAQFWRQAMGKEMAALWEYGVLEQVPATDVPKGHKILPTRWVYTEKYTPTGELDRRKARLVVQGFRQVSGIDVEETFAPTSHRTSLRLLLATVAQENMETKTAGREDSLSAERAAGGSVRLTSTRSGAW
jgi:hypothetical protein